MLRLVRAISEKSASWIRLPESCRVISVLRILVQMSGLKHQTLPLGGNT